MNHPKIDDEMRYRILRLLDANPQLSQRDVARALGVSLGKVNYCLRALILRGWVKAINFKNSRNKLGYLYLLTPAGIERKTSMTIQFLHMKVQEYESLRAEIRQLREEVRGMGG